MEKKHVIESDVEQYFKDMIHAIGGLAMKFKSPGKRGVPDQIVLYKGETYYVEMKKPGEKPRKSQVSVHKEFKDQGIIVYTADTKKEVDKFIISVLKTEIPKTNTTKTNKPIAICNNLFIV